MNKIDHAAIALRDALMAYALLDSASAARAVVAVFGVTNAKRLAPLLEDLARNVQPKA